MQILVSGKQLDVGGVLQSHVDEHLRNRITNKFSKSMVAHVVFSKERHGFRADWSGQELRLRGYNRRLRDKCGHGRPASEIYVAQNFVPAVELEVEEVPEEFQSVVVGEHTTNILCRTVGEADVQPDFVEQPVLMFSNTVDGHLNGVYSRPDSYMGWITSMTESGG